MLPRLPLAIFVLMAMACVDRPLTTNPSPIPPAPTTSSPVPDPSPAGERWNLTTTFRSFTGPQACVATYTPYLGQSDDWSMAIQRSGESIHIVVSDPDDPSIRLEYDGTVGFDVFTAAAKNPLGGRVCGGSEVSTGAEGHVSGHFSESGHALAAQEVGSAQLTSGETLVSYRDWIATQN
jgi:hypothetical protein